MGKITEQQLKEWLESDKHAISVKGDNGDKILYKSPIDDDFILLYYKNTNRNDTIGLTCDLVNSGLYYKKDGCIYNPSIYLKQMCEDTPMIKPSTTLLDFAEQLHSAVKEYVESVVNSNNNKFSKGTISDKWKLDNLSYFTEYTAKEQARRLFLSDTAVSDVVYKFRGKIDEFTGNNYLEFITDRDSIIRFKGDNFIEDNNENILMQFKENSAIKEELQKIYDDPENELYRIKAIIYAVKKSGAKTVNVSINKDNREFSFKYDAEQLCRDPNGYYHTWGMKTSDEKDFEYFFGRDAKFYANDITQISYCRNVIYDSSDFDTTETEDEAITQTM